MLLEHSNAGKPDDYGLKYNIPREVWNIILGFIPCPSVMSLCLVRSSWRELVHGSVTAISPTGFALKLTNNILKRFVGLRSLSLEDSPRVNDDCLSVLTRLTSLELRDNKVITDKGLTRLTNLAYLGLENNAEITNHGVSKLTKLTTLNLNLSVFKSNRATQGLNDNGISGLVNLTALSLRCNENIFAVATLTRLTRLDLYRNRAIRDEQLRELVSLTSLQLSDNEAITSDGISRLTNLQTLGLEWNRNITDTALSFLPRITSLDLSNNYTITKDGLALLPNLKWLEVNVDLGVNIDVGGRGNPIGDDVIKGLTALTGLSLRNNKIITNAALSELTNLETLSLGAFYCNITNDALSRLCKLTTLNMPANKLLTDECLSRLEQLTELDLSGECAITNNGLSCLTNLRTLSLVYNTRITHGGISGLTSLTSLNIKWSLCTRGVRELTNLTWLVFGQSPLPADEVVGLTRLNSLSWYLPSISGMRHFACSLDYIHHLSKRRK
jgi:hypothetical protein